MGSASKKNLLYQEHCEKCIHSDNPGIDCNAPLLSLKHFNRVWSLILEGYMECPFFSLRLSPRIRKVFMVNDATGNTTQQSDPIMIESFKDIGYRECTPTEWWRAIRQHP